eukprot:CAMPEP_0194412552 /NCGR_PEP_ID=MMETSP0176-20130528/11035_1 /TAXON_ID=216777 /ORGANISM="Proboscia alata, Strain PI-D3" /LENGTH=535 /DNA_ID=CAMNT_0039215373 /DNA_START=18 /DNA_END=1625 /DNA_ORIENTATION=+
MTSNRYKTNYEDNQRSLNKKTYRLPIMKLLFATIALSCILPSTAEIFEMDIGSVASNVNIEGMLRFIAKDICTRTLVGNEDPRRIINKYVSLASPISNIIQIDVGYFVRKSVSVRLRGGTNLRTDKSGTAVFRDGIGCTLLFGKKMTDERSFLYPSTVLQFSLLRNTQPFAAIAPPYLSFNNSWPEGAGGVAASIEMQQSNITYIQGAVDRLINEPSYNTQAVLFSQNGDLIAKSYADGYSDNVRFIGMSMTKTLNALLLGVAIKSHSHDVGLVDESASTFITQWKNTNHTLITIRHLLQMASGLQWEETFNRGLMSRTTAVEMVYHSADAIAYAVSLPLASQPGTEFIYSTGDSQLLSYVIDQIVSHDMEDDSTGTVQRNYDFMQKSLFHPLNITSATIECDLSGMFMGGSNALMSAEDWLRIGQLMLNKGWSNDGTLQILPDNWIDMMISPSEVSGSKYGWQLWTYDEELMGNYTEIPIDTYMILGHNHQIMCVIPSRNAVFLRLGFFTGDQKDPQSFIPYFQALQDILEVSP